MAGRLCLVRSVIQSSAVHSMLVYRWPKQILKDVDVACKNFIWTGSILSKPFRSVAWDTVCTPKEYGGLGVRSLKIMNESLLSKIAWKFLKGTDFGYDLLNAKYLNSCLQPSPLRVFSTVWMGARRMLGELVQDSFCSLGDGSSVLFWWDDWLGYRIADKLSIPTYMRPFLTQKVSSYLYDGAWHFTESFAAHYPNIVVDVLLVPLGEREDIRYWKPSLTGEVTSSLVYQHKCKRRITVAWGSWIWANFLPVRRSLVTWRAIRGRLPTYDALIRRGFAGPNICVLCRRDAESIDHIFWNCSIAASVWKSFIEWFDIELPPHLFDLNSFLVFAMGVRLSSQFSSVWKVGVISTIWKIWMDRNSCLFDGSVANDARILVFVKAAIVEAASIFKLGTCSNVWADFQRGRNLGIRCSFAPPHSFVSVSWWPPLPLWIKANTDGSAMGSPGAIAAGGIFRDAAGSVRGCFHADGGVGFACEAELLAAITAVGIAHRHGWFRLWLETDSTYIEHLFKTRSMRVPWRFANTWRKTLQLIDVMEFRISHIYREGNQVADLMAGLDVPTGWWAHSIPLISDAVARDFFSPRFHREV